MTNEEFNAVEKLKITQPVWVKGKFYEKNSTVELSGNDKVQLIGTNKAVVVPVAAPAKDPVK